MRLKDFRLLDFRISDRQTLTESLESSVFKSRV